MGDTKDEGAKRTDKTLTAAELGLRLLGLLT